MSHNSMILNTQWSSRPSDQRYLSVPELYEAVKARRAESRVIDVALDAVQLAPTETGELALTDRNGGSGLLTHWAFGQLCARAKAPAGYLRTLPADLAAIPLQWSMENHEGSDDANDAKLLIRQNGHVNVASVNSPTYGRIWDAEAVGAVRDNVDLDAWTVPAASYSGSDPKRATTLYASDRDVFLFLVNEARIEAAGESLNRGFYLYNSEVGSATFGIATFTYDRICDNRIIWGQKNSKEIKIRHTSGGPHRFLAQAVPQLSAYAESSTAQMADTIKRAKAYEVARDKAGVMAWMKSRGFTKPEGTRAYDAAVADPRGYNPRSVWGIVQGLTDAAHDIKATDERTTLEAKAGALLENLEGSPV